MTAGRNSGSGDNTAIRAVVFESASVLSSRLVGKYVKDAIPVYLVEPFMMYHMGSPGAEGFPATLSDEIRELLRRGLVRQLSAESLGARNLYQFASDRSVAAVEEVFAVYRRRYAGLIDCLAGILHGRSGEQVLKKVLCERLANFFSVNILLHRIASELGTGPILAHLASDVSGYLRTKALLAEMGHAHYENPDMRLVGRSDATLRRLLFGTGWGAAAGLILQTLASILFGRHADWRKRPGSEKRRAIGMSLVSPQRQLAHRRRGPDMLVDGKTIAGDDITCFPLVRLSRAERGKLQHFSGKSFPVPSSLGFFSRGTTWWKLLRAVAVGRHWRDGEEVRAACTVVVNYLKWQWVLVRAGVGHFVSHCDFSVGHIGRNAALREAGVETWYFTDSANGGWSWHADGLADPPRHPFWTCLDYDHFVTWSQSIADYFSRHPDSFRQTHVVGCLWSGYGEQGVSADTGGEVFRAGSDGNTFVLACFDTTYSKNGVASYAEAALFARHIEMLVEEFPGVCVVFKEKKARSVHAVFDADHGPELEALYDRMARNERITFYPHDRDPADVASAADMVVSFPFTSTTFEALSANRPAVWHDPMGLYRDCPNGRVAGAVTFGYDELARAVAEVKRDPKAWRNPYPAGSPLLDPHRDGRAMDRFRELLTAAQNADTRTTDT